MAESKKRANFATEKPVARITGSQSDKNNLLNQR